MGAAWQTWDGPLVDEDEAEGATAAWAPPPSRGDESSGVEDEDEDEVEETAAAWAPPPSVGLPEAAARLAGLGYAFAAGLRIGLAPMYEASQFRAEPG